MKTQNQMVTVFSIAGAAALLSVITGFVSGVTPAGILLRAFFIALGTAGFSFLCSWLIKTFLPELYEYKTEGAAGVVDVLADADPAAEAGNLTGNRVNIVMEDDGEDSAGNQSSRESGTAADGEGGTSLPENEIAGMPESVHNSKPEGPVAPAGMDGLDSLPNLDSLDLNMGASSYDGETAPVEEAPASEGTVSLGGSMRRDSAPVVEGDPADIAKAVKTVLARDEQK